MLSSRKSVSRERGSGGERDGRAWHFAGGRFAQAKFRPTALPTTLVTRSVLHERLTAGAGKRLTVVVGSAGAGKSVLLSSWVRHDHLALLPGWPAIWLMPTRFASGSASSRRPGQWRRSSAPMPLTCSRWTGPCRLMSSRQSLTMPRSCPPVRRSSLTTSMTRRRRPLGPWPIWSSAGRPKPPSWCWLAAATLRCGCIGGGWPVSCASFATVTCISPWPKAVICWRTSASRSPPLTCALLHQRSEGWAAALQMVALSLRGATDRLRVVRALDVRSHAIAEYFISEVLDQQPPEIAQFMLDTSILGELTADALRGHHRTAGRGGAAPQHRHGQPVPGSARRSTHQVPVPPSGAPGAARRAARQGPGPRAEAQPACGRMVESTGDARRAARHFLAARQADRALTLIQDRVMAEFLQDPALPPNWISAGSTRAARRRARPAADGGRRPADLG